MVLVEDTEGAVGDSLPLRFTRSLCWLDEFVEDLVDQSQARDLSDYGTAPLGDIGELFQFWTIDRIHMFLDLFLLCCFCMFVYGYVLWLVFCDTRAASAWNLGKRGPKM